MPLIFGFSFALSFGIFRGRLALEIRKHPYSFASLGALLVETQSTGFPGAIHAYVSAVAAGVKGSLFISFVSPPGRVPAPSRSPYYSVAYCD